VDGRPLTTASAAEFRETLPGGGALIALDIGTKTIGTAFCDARWSFAGAGKTLPRGKFSADRAKLEALIAPAPRPAVPMPAISPP